MSTHAERHTASIKEFNSLLRGWIDPTLSAEQKHARLGLIQETRAAFSDDEMEPAPPPPPKVCPMSRAKLRKVIKTAIETAFDESVIQYHERGYSVHAGNTMSARDVAVGCAQLEFDESDPVFIICAVTYKHGPTTRDESEAILNALHVALSSDSMGPAKDFINTFGGRADFAVPEKLFKVDFKVRCPA